MFIIATSAWGQAASESGIYSEAPIVVENGVKMSPQLTVHFKERVFDLPAGAVSVTRNEMENAFTDLNAYFSGLEQKYGSITFIKQIPEATWGDVWHMNKRTGKMVQLHDMSQLFTIHFNRFVPIDFIIQELEQMEEVLYAHQPIQAVSLNDPNDPSFNPTDQWNLFKINAPQAWDINTGSSDIVVGIIEVGGTGIGGVPDRNHIDFILPSGESKFVPGLGDFSPIGPHATQVAGIVGAATDDGEGIASLGWDILMIPYRFINYDPNPNNQNGLVNRINTAVADGVDVINCSFVTINTSTGQQGCGPDSSENPLCVVYGGHNYPSVSIAIHDAIEDGVVVVAGTGNTGWEVTNQHPDCIECLPIPYTPYPAAYAGVIGVSASNINDEFGTSIPVSLTIKEILSMSLHRESIF